MKLTRETCADLMPQLENSDLVIKELKGGITNQLYYVRSPDDDEYVFRFYGANTELFINRDVEKENLLQLEFLKVTPKLVKYVPERNVTIVEFIPGYVLTNRDFLKEDLWEKIVRPVRIIHRSSAKLPYQFNPLEEVRRFYKILEGINPNYPEFDFRGTIQSLETVWEILTDKPLHFVPCHNDLLAENFVLTSNRSRYEESMCLIDWEYGGMAPAHYDIADMFQEILAPREVERGLLEVYCEGKDVDSHQYRTDLLKPFPDIYWFLWSLIQLNVSNIDFDYYTYGEKKYENAQKNIRYLKEHYGL